MPGFWEIGESQVSIAIATPHAAVTPLTMDWFGSLINLEKPPGSQFVAWKGLPVHVARNRMVKDAQRLKAAYIFMLDSDVKPAPNSIMRLLTWRLPIVSGLYWSKRGYPGAWTRDPVLTDKYNPIPAPPPSRQYPTNLMEVDALGMGCCLIDMRVFDVIPFPWFDWTILDPLGNIGVSEDFYFCNKAQEHGFPIYLATEVRCTHESYLPVEFDGNVDLPGPQGGSVVEIRKDMILPRQLPP